MYLLIVPSDYCPERLLNRSSLTLTFIYFPDANKNDTDDVEMDSQVEQGKCLSFFFFFLSDNKICGFVALRCV